MVDRSEHQVVAVGQRERGAPPVEAGDEVVGAVDRVDHPGAAAGAGAGSAPSSPRTPSSGRSAASASTTRRSAAWSAAVTTSEIERLRADLQATAAHPAGEGPRLAHQPYGELRVLAELTPGLGQQGAGVREQLRQHLGAADDRDEVRVTRPPRHDVLVEVLRQRAAGDSAEVEADVEGVRPADLAQHAHRLLRRGHQLGHLVGGEVLELGDVPVRQHHQVAGVVGVQVEDREAGLTPVHHQALLERDVRHRAERAAPVDRLARSDVRHPVRGPEPVEALEPVALVAGGIGHGTTLG